MRKMQILIASVVITACQNDPYGVGQRPPGERIPPTAPIIDTAYVSANPNNVISALIHTAVQQVDSVAVHFRLADASAAEEMTPAVVAMARVGAVRPRIAVLGLLPESRYTMQIVAWGPGGMSSSREIEFTTAALPADLPRYTAGGPDPTPGYVVFAAGEYGLVIDNTGRIVWYHHFPDGAGLAFPPQANDRYVARPRTANPADREPWVEIDPAGDITGVYGCRNGLQPRLHDLIVEPDGGYWILCDETRVMDLAGVGGVDGARVTGTTVQYACPYDDSYYYYYYYYCYGPNADFNWSPFDHFAITDVEAFERLGPNVNWTHGNSIALDGVNLIVSFRNLNEITKIDRSTGRVIWRLGGLRNEFTFIDTPVPAFTHQHSVRMYGNELLLLDNLGDPGESRVERYALNEGDRTARLIGSFSAGPGVVTTLGGSVQALPGGRTLASFGTAGRVVEFDAAGNIVWSIEGNAGYVFRAQRITSLYAPGVGTTR